MSTCYEIAAERRKQINAEFKKSERQMTDTTIRGRKSMLAHLRKLSQKTSGRDRSFLRAMGWY